MTDQIYVGAYFFDASAIRSINMTSAVDIIGSQLSIDLLVPVVEYEYTGDGGMEILSGADFDEMLSTDDYIICTNRAYDDLRLVPYGTPVKYYRDGELRFKAYVKSVDRTGRRTYKITAISAIGLLDAQTHLGGLYTGADFEDVVADIIGDTAPYTVDAAVAVIDVYGWLPIASKRANLHQLLFASGVMVDKDAAGNMLFRFLDNTDTTTVPQGRIYIEGSVDYSSPATAVQVTEHAFLDLQTDETVTLYDNTDGSGAADHTFVAFQAAPIHDLAVTGTLTIDSSGVNWAVVSGTGTLTGQRYTHSTRILTKEDPDATGETDNVIAVTDATLVTILNSENVAARVLSYYSSKRTVSSSIVMEGEKAGMLISGTDAFYEPFSGFIASIEATVSAVIKGSCKIVTDYIPTGGGNNYTEAHLYDGDGEIDFAELVDGKSNDIVQVILLGGGHGGYSGEDGGAGTEGSQGSPSPVYGTPGEGGAGGAPGEGGKVFSVTFHVGDLQQTTLSYSCGAGGASDTDGDPTTLGLWSSEDGAVTPYGISNIFTGITYGTAGIESGQPGGAGNPRNGYGPNISYNGQTWTPGTNGKSSTSGDYAATGGTGGGAAVGANGGNGEDSIAGSYGDGGDGANGGAGTDATGYGVGGNGGHGGGGAGVGGASESVGPWWFPGPNGTPGQGGPGGFGSPGLIIVYV